LRESFPDQPGRAHKVKAVAQLNRLVTSVNVFNCALPHRIPSHITCEIWPLQRMIGFGCLNVSVF
jgi:hypothetical protein